MMIFNRQLFLTHTPDLSFGLNKKWRDDQGKTWIMKKIKQVSATRLADGNVASCWAVYGKRKS